MQFRLRLIEDSARQIFKSTVARVLSKVQEEVFINSLSLEFRRRCRVGGFYQCTFARVLSKVQAVVFEIHCRSPFIEGVGGGI